MPAAQRALADAELAFLTAEVSAEECVNYCALHASDIERKREWKMILLVVCLLTTFFVFYCCVIAFTRAEVFQNLGDGVACVFPGKEARAAAKKRWERDGRLPKFGLTLT